MSGESGVLSKAFETLSNMAAARARHGISDERVRRLRDSCVRDLRSVLDTQGWLSVVFTDGSVKHMGGLVLSGGLAGPLEGAGIRALSVEPHAVQAELEALLEILTREWVARSPFDEDLTSAVWRSDFQNIHIDLVEAPKGTETGVPRALDALRTHLVEGSAGRIVFYTPTPDSSSRVTEFRREAAEIADPLDIPELDRVARSVVERDVDAVTSGEDVDDNQVSQVLFEVLRLEFSEKGAEEVGRGVARLALDRLDKSDPVGMACLVRRPLVLLRAPFRGRFHHGNAFREGLSDFICDAWRPHVVGALGRLNDPSEAVGPMFTFLSAMHPRRAQDLAHLCSACPTPELSQAVADALVAVFGLDKQPLMNLLESDDPRLHLAPLLAYSRMNATQAVGACLLRIRSPDPRIREAALRALRHHDNDRIRAAGIELLQDDDSRVRIEAMRHAAVHRDPKAKERVEAQVFGAAVEDIGEPELKALLITYGILGGDEAVDRLMDLLMDRRTLAGKHPRLKSFAVRGLMAVGTKRAQQAITEVAKRVPEVRDAIRELRMEKARR